MQEKRYTFDAARLLAILAATLAVIVMSGWLLRVDVLIQLHPTLVPMQFNTALALFMSAMALECRHWSPKVISLGFSSSALLLAGMTLLEYLSGRDLGIDNLFIEPHIVTHSPNPGRMAVNTALAYCLVNLGIMLSQFASRPVFNLMASAISACVIGLSSISLFGYMTGLAPAFGWGADFSRMAPHTASGFCLLGTSLLISTGKSEYINRFFYKWLLAVTMPATLTFMLCLQIAITNAKSTIHLQNVVLGVLALLLMALLYVVVLLAEARAKGGTINKLLLRQSSAFNAMLDGLLVISHHGIIEDVNESLCKLLAYSRSELIGANIKLIMPDEIAGNHDAYLAAFQRDRVAKVLGNKRSMIARSKSGEQIPVELQVTNYRIAGEEYFCGVLHDERQLKESDERYRLVLEGAGVGIWDWLDVSADEQFWSEKYYWLLGYEPNEITAARETFLNLLHPSDMVRTMAASQDHFLKHEPYVVEARLRCKNQRFRWFRITGKATRDPEGKPQRMVGSIEDIQARKDLELEQVRLVSILNHSPDYICQLDKQHQPIFINSAMRQLLDISDLQQVSFTSWFSEADRALLDTEVFLSASEKNTWTGEVELVDCKQRLVICSMVFISHKNYRAEITHYSAVLRNITQQKEQERELLRSNKELENFAHVASHDLKEPARTVLSFSEYLIHDIAHGRQDRVEKDIRFIRNACTRMNHLIDDMLQLSRVGTQTLKLEAVDMSQVFQEVQEQLSAQLSESGAKLELPESCPRVFGDRGTLSRVFMNLISNALKFQVPGHTPRVSVKHIKEESQFVTFLIIDNGIGIAEEHQQEIFNVYKKLHRQEDYAGTGIGLAVVSKAVRRLGGDISVESRLGEGSTFKVKLPEAE